LTGTISRPLPVTPTSPRGWHGWRGPRVVVLASAVAFLVLVLVWVLAFSPVLGAKTVTVRGVHTVTVDQVRSIAGISNGSPLIRLDTAAVRQRVETLPDVASARVSVSYPSTVVIVVTERVPVGYLVSQNGFVLVDKAGMQFRAVTTAPPALPRFALPAGPSAQASGQAVATAAGALSSSVLGQLAEIRANDASSISLVLRDGRSVIWGSADRSVDKARLLPVLLTRPGTTFDVSNPDLAVVR
jgi:cell division protein FtsQ